MSALAFNRTDTSVLGRWWWTVDRWLLAATVLIIAIGTILLMAAGPAAAERINVDPFHFVRRQFVFLPLGVLVILAVSLLSPLWVRRLGFLGFGVSYLLLLATLGFAAEVKGSTRWLSLGGLSVQPSEFVKPSFAVFAAWMLSEGRLRRDFPGYRIAVVAFLAVAITLLKQPDLGQTVVISAIFGVQFFLAGLPLILIAALVVGGFAALFGAYLLLPHVQSRMDRFFNPEGHVNYQIEKAMEAFSQGGMFGVGPGEGKVKQLLPDSHTDFIFAVAGEEFGILLCLLLVGLFAFIVLRGLGRTLQEGNLFILLAVGGLMTQFGLQALINMASSLHMMPTKGMTLPFISYGGSSMVALALGMGMILALTRRRPSGGLE